VASDVLDEAYVRLHHWGPEWGGENGLSNHGPMAVEVLSRLPEQSGVIRDRFARLADLPAWTPSLTTLRAPASTAEIPAAPAGAPPSADLMARAAEHGDEHVIKLTDTALDAYARTADPALLTAATHCAELIDPPR
jgi:hypothetical protein